MALEIRTNHHWKDLVSFYDLPTKAQKDFDYIEEEERWSTRLFSYRGSWYDVNEFMRVWDQFPNEFKAWHGYQSDSFFSGVLVRYSEDFEQVQVATYMS